MGGRDHRGLGATRCAVGRSLPDRLESRVVRRRGLLGIEGFSVRVRFDPDRLPQRAVLTAASVRRRQLLLEVRNPLESGGRVGHTCGGVALHRDSLAAHGRPGLFNRAPRPSPTDSTNRRSRVR